MRLAILLLALLSVPALASGPVTVPVTSVALDLSPYARKTDMPMASNTTPPGTAIDSALGSSVQFARADHTHATSVQRTRMAVSTAGTPIRWTFAKPYDTGTIPVVTCTAQNVSGATLPLVVNTVVDPTTTYADIAVFRAQTQMLGGTLIAIAGTTINLFAAAPAGTIVNCQAARATQ